jgi:hypothetical protein
LRRNKSRSAPFSSGIFTVWIGPLVAQGQVRAILREDCSDDLPVEMPVEVAARQLARHAQQEKNNVQSRWV